MKKIVIILVIAISLFGCKKEDTDRTLKFNVDSVMEMVIEVTGDTYSIETLTKSGGDFTMLCNAGDEVLYELEESYRDQKVNFYVDDKLQKSVVINAHESVNGKFVVKQVVLYN